MKKSTDMPSPVQEKFPIAGVPELSEANVYPRCTEFDLKPVASRTRIGSWGDEQTFEVTKRGNKE